LEILRPNRKIDSAASKRFTVGDRPSTLRENRDLADYGIWLLALRKGTEQQVVGGTPMAQPSPAVMPIADMGLRIDP